MTTTAPVATAAPEKLTASQLTTIVVLAASTFFALVSELVMGVALPTIMTDFGVTASTAQWLTTGYALTLAVIIPTTGYLLRRFRIRSVFVVSMSLFSIGTAIAAAAPTFEVLLTARVVQALGTAVLLPLLMTTTFGMVAPAKRAQMMATITAVVSLAPAVAPAFAGFVMAQLDWRWLFITVLPLAILGLIFGALKIPSLNEPKRAPFDLLSLVLAAIGFGAVVFGLSAAGEGAHGEIPASFWIAVPLGILGVGAFVVRQRRLQNDGTPMMDMRIFTRRGFSVSILQFVFLVSNSFGLAVLLPLVLQNALGLGVFETGLFMAPGGIVIILTSLLVGKLYNRLGARALMLSGAVIVVAGWAAMRTFDQTTPVWVVLATFLILTIGQCLSWVALFTLALDSLPDDLHAHGSAALNTMHQLAGAAGLAILVSVFTLNSPGDTPAAVAAGGQAAFTAGAVIALCSLIVSFFAPRRQRVDHG
ncbi:DHA2 family efflux MFS transporter permease subunit [[Micrococcus luteus] ATCC 49442]|uniref:DHA2 family efflux MFS transporter permease subunit n=1 Tax=[Micrococcus luteus] ATCC 49442 TaxID=2698727 RepID=UPI0013DBDF1D|nr:DHA2 family efflux MFS transporter permease subunit [[Micrococcus luteus] ATCC 49442]